MTCDTRLSVAGIRVRKPRWARGTALSSLESVASATRDLGASLLAKVVHRASARSLKIWLSEALPSQHFLAIGTPPSWETIRAHTACCKSGR